MKNIYIGDIHGRNDWKQIINQEKTFDKVVFVGDYFDSFDISIKDQINNFKDIIQYKKDNWDKVVLLLGNHDYSYFFEEIVCSGYKQELFILINSTLINLFKKNYFRIAIELDDYVISHAGITKTWISRVQKKLELDKHPSLEDLKEIFWSKHLLFDFGFLYEENDVNSFKMLSKYGDNVWQGPFWVRPNSLMQDRYFKKQIIGHTQVKPNGHIRPKSDVIQIDALANKEYLVIENGTPSVGKIKK